MVEPGGDLMAWVAVTWATGDTITEAKLDQMEANALHLYESGPGRGRWDGGSAGQLDHTWDESAGDNLPEEIFIRGRLDGFPSASSTINVESSHRVLGNLLIDLSARAVGWHTITLEVQGDDDSELAETVIVDFYLGEAADLLRITFSVYQYTATGIVSAFIGPFQGWLEREVV